jgi:hypothetical protein
VIVPVALLDMLAVKVTALPNAAGLADVVSVMVGVSLLTTCETAVEVTEL